MRFLFEFDTFVAHRNDGVLNEREEYSGYFVYGADGINAQGINKQDWEKWKNGTGWDPQLKGWTKGMKVSDWMKTKDFERYERKIFRKAQDNESEKALESFKKEHPEDFGCLAIFIFGADPCFAAESRAKYKLAASNTLKAGIGYKKGPEKAEPGTEGLTYPSVKITTEEEDSTSDWFEMNSADLSDKFKKWIDTEIINPTADALKTLNPPQGKPAAWLKGLKIGASCSTIPNLIGGKVVSFKKLADMRAQAAEDYITSQLKKIGVLVDKDTEIVKETDGKNVGKKLTADLGSLKKGASLTGSSGPLWDGKLESRDKLKDYQRVDVSTIIVFNDQKKPITDPGAPGIKIPSGEPFITTEGTFECIIHYKEKVRIEVGNPLEFLGNIFKGSDKKNRGRTSCPKF